MAKVNLRVVDERQSQVNGQGPVMNFGIQTFLLPEAIMDRGNNAIRIRHEGTSDAEISLNFLPTRMSIEEAEALRDWLDACITIARDGALPEARQEYWIEDEQGRRTQTSDHQGGDVNFTDTLDEIRSAISYYFEAEYGRQFMIVDALTGEDFLVVSQDEDGNIVESQPE